MAWQETGRREVRPFRTWKSANQVDQMFAARRPGNQQHRCAIVPLNRHVACRHRRCVPAAQASDAIAAFVAHPAQRRSNPPARWSSQITIISRQAAQRRILTAGEL
jgi:hypothetical protein